MHIAPMLRLAVLAAAGLALAQGYLLVSSNYRIHRVDVTSGASVALPINTAYARITYDPYTSRVIWSIGGGITASHLDGSGRTTLANGRSRINSIQATKSHSASNKVYYGSNDEIRVLDLATLASLTVAKAAYPHYEQFVISKQNSSLFYKGHREVWQVDLLTNDSSSNTRRLPGSMDINGMALSSSPSGDTLYFCSGYSTPSGYYSYDLKTSVLKTLGSASGHGCRKLETDGQNLYILDENLGIFVASLTGSNFSTTLLYSSRYLQDLELITSGFGCSAQRPLFEHPETTPVSVPDVLEGGDTLKSYRTTERADCRVTGDNDTLALFTAAANDTACTILLRPGQHLNAFVTPNYKLMVELIRPCDMKVTDRKEVTLQIKPSCQGLPESMKAGQVALQISLSKPLQVRMREDTRGRPSVFKVNTSPNMAQVVLTRALDHEAMGSRPHRFTLEVDFCTRVTDLNDNPPLFLFPNATFGSVVSWDEGRTGIVATVRATDKDSAKFGTLGLRYSILNDQTGHFTINPVSGELSIVKGLQVTSAPGQIPIVLEVKDNEGVSPYNKAMAVLLVNIVDINDNKPTFPMPQYSATVLEVARVGQQVLTVAARDDDVGPNAQLTYYLTSPNTSAPFTINPSTGDISVSDNLWGRAGVYHMSVTARDGGTPPLFSSVPVTLHVQSITSISGRRRRNALPRRRSAAD